MVTIPGAATPSEAFAGIAAGAHAVKVFPAEMITPSILASWRAVIPASAGLLPVGSIDHTNMADYWQAGASGFGLGGSLYKPNLSLGDISANATKLAWSMASTMKI
jgi:2-dehydro-3-deoxyphosphogalactonate aldolase